MNNTELAIKLFNPNENGISRWVSKEECVGEYNPLYPTNGNHWYRNTGLKKFIFEKKIEEGKIFWRFNGLKNDVSSREIRPDIWNEIRQQSCVITGLKLSGGHKIEVDHKDGRYPDKVLTFDGQTIDDFQPLLESLNKQKRSDCIKCKTTEIRFDAKEKGFSVSIISGSLKYEGTCKGCYWYDVKEFISELK
jgi:hypothetical protein